MFGSTVPLIIMMSVISTVLPHVSKISNALSSTVPAKQLSVPPLVPSRPFILLPFRFSADVNFIVAPYPISYRS